MQQFKFYQATLHSSDVHRIFCWFQFKIHTANESCKLTDAIPSAAESEKRIRRFINGYPEKGYGPLDLQTTTDMEPVLVSNDIQNGYLLGIDGNHRMVAQLLSGKSFENVSVFVVENPHMSQWEYVPESARRWSDAQQKR